jgi:hypothetical protein
MKYKNKMVQLDRGEKWNGEFSCPPLNFSKLLEINSRYFL